MVNHLTRMGHPYICIAGIGVAPDASVSGLQSYIHVRPTMGRRWEEAHCRTQDGVLQLGSVIELFAPQAVGRAPEVEDWSTHGFRVKGQIKPDKFWSVINSVKMKQLSTIFGEALILREGQATLPGGQGIASLGVLEPRSKPHLFINKAGKLRLRIEDEIPLFLSVTDVRFYQSIENSWQLSNAAVEEFQGLFGNREKILLSVGVSRSFSVPPRHWVQVNNIHVESDPFWAP